MRKTKCGISLGEVRVSDLYFTDDVAIIAETFSCPLEGKMGLPKTVIVQAEHFCFAENFFYIMSATGSQKEHGNSILRDKFP